MKRGGSGCRRRALSLVEAVVSIVIVGVMAVAAFAAVGATRSMEYRIAERERGLLLAEDLMAEILRQSYTDPVGGSDSFGPGSAEAATGDRSLFNDVDDYAGWSASPPQFKDGTDRSELADWKRTVEVIWVDSDAPDEEAKTNQNLKKITVRVLHREREVMALSALRAGAARDAVEVERMSLPDVVTGLSMTVSELVESVRGGGRP